MGRRFDFSGVVKTLPICTFEQRLEFSVGEKQIECVDLGPAHTRSDVIVYVPADRILFTGDLLFNEGHPIMWEGPVENWIGACDYILALPVEVVVPGHGPITDKSAVMRLKHYLGHLRREARVRFEAGLGYEEAAQEIELSEFRGWSDSERLVANVFSLYRAWGAAFDHSEQLNLFAAMGRYRKSRTGGRG